MSTSWTSALSPRSRSALDLFSDPREAGNPDQKAREWLSGNGVAASALTFPFYPFSIKVARVLHREGRYQPCAVGQFAYIFPAVADSKVIDAVAWSPSSETAGSELSSRLGVAGLLGEHLIGLDGRGITGLPLRIHRDPLGLLRDNWDGVVVLDWEYAAHRLTGVHLALPINDPGFANTLKKRLVVPPPSIVRPRQCHPKGPK